MTAADLIEFGEYLKLKNELQEAAMKKAGGKR